MALLTSITALTPNTTTTNAPYVSDGAGALGFPELGTNSSVIFRVTFDGLVTTVDAADFTLNSEAVAAGGAIGTVVATDATNTVFDVQVVGLGNFDGELTLSISNSQSITGYTGVSPTFTNETFLLETTQPGIVSILRVSDLNGTLVANPNVNSSSVLFQVQFTEAVRNVDISDFVPIGSAVISGVSVTDFDIANNAISFTDVNGVTYADTYVYTVSGLDGLSGNIGLALSQGVNGIRDVDGTSLINTAPPQGLGLDQTYTVNNLSTTPFVSVVASDADAREDRITLTVTTDIITSGNITSNPNSLLPYDFITVVGSDDRTLTIEVRDKDGDLVNIGTPIASDFVLETLPPSLVIEPVSDLDFTSRDFGVQISGLRFYTGSTSNLLQASGGFDVQNSSGEDVPSSEIASITYFSDPLFNTSITTLNGNDIIYAKITFSTSNIDPTTVNIGGGTSDFVTSVNGLTKVPPAFSIASVAGSNGTYTLGLTETTDVSGTQIRVALNDNTTLAPTTGQSGSDTGEYVITRTGDLTNPLTVNFTFAGTTETTDFQVFDSNGNQLSNTGDSVTIAANQTSTTIRVFANTDLTTEGSETLRLVLSPSSDPNNVYTVQSAAGSASVFISDSFDLQGNDLPIPQVSIVATDPVADEGTGEPARFVINIAGNDDAGADLNGLAIALVAGGSAVIGEDYVIQDADGVRFSTLEGFIAANLTVIPSGVDQIEFLVIPNRDFVAGNRTVTFTIQSSSQNPFLGDQADYTVGTPFVAGATILDVDAPIAIPDISIVASDPVGSEANKETITFTLTRTTANTGPLTVFLQVGGDATAFEGELPPPDEQLLPEGVDYITDYQVTAGIIAVTFNEGETLKTITVTPVDDLDLDNGFTDEVISLTILPSAFYTINDNATATGVIVNDEEPAVVIIDPTTEISEGGVQTFTVRIDGNAIGQDLQVTFNVGGSATNPNLLADANGSTDTGVDAGDDYLIPNLYIETEEDAFGNTRVTTTAPTVIIPAGSTSATFTVQTVDDGLGLDDDGETVVINLTAGAGYVVGTQNESTLTIRDINDRGVVSLAVTDNTAQESDLSVASYTLERSGDNLQAVAVTFDVTGTGTFGVDYRIEAYDSDNPTVNLLVGVANPVVNGVFTLNLPQGSPVNTTAADPQRIRIDIVPINDPIRDNTSGVPETVTLTLQQSSQDPTRGPSRLYSIRDGQTTGTVNIVDDDPLISPTITLDPVVDNLAEGGTTTITVRLVGGNIFGSEIPINLTLGGNGVLGTDYTLTDASGVAVTNSIIFTSDDIRDTNGDGAIDAVFKTLTLTAISDGVGLNDDGETVIFSLTDGTGYNLTDPTSGTVTLRDRSDRGTVSVVATDPVAAETDANTVDNLGTFTFTRTGDNLDTTLTVTFSLAGTATFNTDYTTAVTGQVNGGITSNPDGTFSFTFAALGTETGTQTATVTVTPSDDLLFESTTGFETINLTLQDGGTSYSEVVGQTNTTVNLVDDEVALPPTITIVAVDPIAGETPVGTPANTGRFRVFRGIFLGSDPNDATQLSTASNYANRGNTTDQAIVVSFTIGGTAGVNDYTTIPTTATIAAGEYYVDVVVSPIDDAIANDNSETVTVTLVENAPTYLLGDTDAAPRTGTVTILDNDGNAPTVSVVAVPGFADEQGTSAFFTVSRTQDDNPTAAITVNFTLSGIAAPSTDYEVFDQNGNLVALNANASGTITLGANVFATTLEIRPIADSNIEANETVTLTLNASPSYTLPSTGTSGTTVIADSAVPPTDRVVPEVSITALDPEGSESPQTTASFLVTFDGNNVNTNPDGNLEIALQLDGTATLGQDYFVTSPDLGEDNQPIVTGNIIRIQNIPATAIGANGVNTVTLIITPFDDADAESLETVTLRVLPSTENEDSANFADYTLAAPQDTVASVTIVDNDVLVLPTVSINANPTSVDENNPNILARPVFTISRSGGSSLNDPLTVFYTISGSARAGTDYTALTGSVTIAAGQSSATVEIAPLDDLIFEGTESVILTLTDPVQGPPQYILGTDFTAGIAITDNETLPGALPEIEVTFNAPSADENDATDRAIFTFTRTGATDTELTVNYTIGGNATNGTDYQPITGTITFAVGEASRDLVITAIDDVALEGPETVTVSITPDAGGAYTIGTARVATVFIIDNENNAPTLNAAILDDFVLNEDAGAVVLRNGNNRTFAQLVQDAFADEDINVPENENETLKAIRFVTLTASGNLTLNGVLVTENQVVEFATNAEVSEFLDSLRYEPDPDFFGQSEDLQSRPDRFTIVASDGVSDSRETDVVINVRPVNDAPFYVLPGEDSFNGGSAAQHNDFYQDSSIIGNLAFSGGNTRNFALRPGVRVSIRDFVQGGANEPNPVVGPENERVNRANSVLPAGNQTLTFSTDLVGDDDIFDEAPTIAADGTLTFKLKDAFPGGFGTAQVRLSVQDTGGTANNGIDTLVKGFFIVTGDENALSNVIQTFETPVGGTGSLIYNTTVFPVGEDIGVNLHQGVLQLGTSASLDNIVGLYEIVDPDGGIDQGKDLDGDGKITTLEELQAKDGIADIYPTAENRVAYAEAALENRVTSWNLRAGSNGDPLRNFSTTTFNAQRTGIEGGSLYAPFIIANGGEAIVRGNAQTVNQAINFFLSFGNPNNNPASSITDPVAYFGFSEVNPDGAEHLRYLRNETAIVNGRTQTIGIYGFEDMPGGGDRDFNDAIFGFQFVAS